MKARIILLCGASMLVGGWSETALAQTVAGSQAAAQTTNSSSTGIPEIVVQARKRNEALMQAPVVAEVVTKEQVQNLRITNAQQLASVTPGLTIAPVSAVVGAVVNLRGLGNGDTAAALDQSVLLNIDGASLPSGLFYRGSLFDVGQIEVLKGPQSLFFGKSSTAGIIAIHSAEPTSYWDTSITTGYEFNAGEFRTEGHISGPITPDPSMRLAGYYSHIDGYLTDPNPGNTVHHSPNGNEDGERFSLRYTPAGTRLRVKFNISRSNLFELGGPGDEVQDKCAGSTPQVPAYQAYDDCKVNTSAGALPNSPPYNPNLNYNAFNLPAFVTGTPNPLFKNGEGYTQIETNAATLNADYELTPGLTLTSLSAHSYAYGADASTVATPSTGLIWLATQNREEDWSQELRLTSNWTDRPVNFMAGLLYDSLTGANETALVIPSVPVPVVGPLGLYTDNSTKYVETTYSGFGQLLIDPIKTVELSLGARYTQVDRHFTSLVAHNNDPSFFLPGPPGEGIGALPTSAPVGGLASGIKEHNISPEATLTWRPTSDVTAFVSYKQGYKGPGFSVSSSATTFYPGYSATPPVTTVGGEKVDGFEGGVKAFLLERRLALTVSGYDYTYHNLQVSVVSGSNFSTSVFNGADARVQGVEASLDYRPSYVPGLSVGLFANYNDSRYIRFKSAPCYGGQTVAQGCVNSAQNLAGKPLPKAPAWSGRLDVGYERDLWDKYKASADLNVNFSSPYNVTQEGNPLGVQSSYATLDLAVHFGPRDDRWSLGLIGRNLTNTIYMIDGTDTGAAITSNVADITVGVSRPREVMLQLTVKL